MNKEQVSPEEILDKHFGNQRKVNMPVNYKTMLAAMEEYAREYAALQLRPPLEGERMTDLEKAALKFFMHFVDVDGNLYEETKSSFWHHKTKKRVEAAAKELFKKFKERESAPLSQLETDKIGKLLETIEENRHAMVRGKEQGMDINEIFEGKDQFEAAIEVYDFIEECILKMGGLETDKGMREALKKIIELKKQATCTKELLFVLQAIDEAAQLFEPLPKEGQ